MGSEPVMVEKVGVAGRDGTGHGSGGAGVDRGRRSARWTHQALAFIALACRLAVGGILLATGTTKFLQPVAFLRAVEAYRLLPGWAVTPAAALVAAALLAWWQQACCGWAVLGVGRAGPLRERKG